MTLLDIAFFLISCIVIGFSHEIIALQHNALVYLDFVVLQVVQKLTESALIQGFV